MNYEEFKSKVEMNIKNYLPKKYEHWEVEMDTVYKVNRVLDGIRLRDPDREVQVSPTVYVQDFYEMYVDKQNFNSVMREISAFFQEGINKINIDFRLDVNEMKSKVIIQLINTEQNEKLLKGIPHREFLDMSIIYRWIIGMDENGIKSTIVDNNLADYFKMSEEELYRIAYKNMEKKINVRTMQEVFSGIKQEMDDFISDDVLMKMESCTADRTMWMISNEYNYLGASAILYEKVLQNIACYMNSDLYLLPVSVHEMLAVSADAHSVEVLAATVEEANRNSLDLEIRLSNQVYYYDKDLRKMFIATENREKRLDYETPNQAGYYGMSR